ncbi:MAG: hypothetical protein ACP5U2_02060 [Bryobacteraceae bacterium]
MPEFAGHAGPGSERTFSAENVPRAAQKAGFLLQDVVALARVQSQAAATEAFVHAHLRENDLLQVHSALGSLHVVQPARALAFLVLEFPASLFGQLALQLGLLPTKYSSSLSLGLTGTGSKRKPRL